MSMNNLTIDGEFRYIVQWFNEWSELQRDDFVPILVNYITDAHTNEDDDNVELAVAVTTPINMNGLPNDLEFNGRPMSLFQCRIKLFRQWNRKWPAEFKKKLQQKITEIDSKVGEKIITALKRKIGGSLTNGYASNEQNNLEQLKESDNEENLNIDINNAEVLIPVPLNDTMSEVLNNETSVDDIETNEEVNNMIEQPLFNNIATATSGFNDDDGSVDDCGNNAVVGCGNAKHNHAINEHCGEPVERVVQMQNLQINEETDNEHEDVTTVDQKQQQEQQQTVAVTVNPVVVVSQALTTNAEVPLVV